jgi:PadR family transcriptional regulator
MFAPRRLFTDHLHAPMRSGTSRVDERSTAADESLVAPCGAVIPRTTMHFGPRHGRAEMRIDKDLVAASATPLVLAILADDESYGYALAKRVRELSSGELEWTDGMLYPLLHRLVRLGYVTTDWRTSAEGRRRRYYAITNEGRAALADQQRQWMTVTRALDGVWGGFARLSTAWGEA